MKYYAQLNADSLCIGISALSGEVRNDSLISISTFDEDYLWRKYDHETGLWSEEKYEPTTTAPLTEFEQMKQRLEASEDAILALMLGGAN